MALLDMKNLLSFCLICSSFFSYAQTESGSLETYLNNYLAAMPGDSGNDYSSPTTQELDDWELTLGHLLTNDLVAARALATMFNYQVKEYTDTDGSPDHDYYILEEKSPASKHWGTYVLNPTACRETLILQAPHPDEDFNTGKQAAYCFVRLNAKALFFPGTNRCNHSSFSSCDGSTSVCSESTTAYRISDVAHNDDSPFQRATEKLYTANNNAVFVQVHGFAKKETDPYVIMGNGTQDTPVNDHVLTIKNALFAVDNTLTFKVGHVDLAWDRLLGTTNTQGRYLNGSVDPCDDAATTSDGNFVHLEQEKTKLRADASGWEKLATALENAFSCASLSTKAITHSNLYIHPNPSSQGKITISGLPFQKLVLYDSNGKVRIQKTFAIKNSVTLDVAKLSKGVYILGVFSDEKGMHRKIVLQ